ncbi:MAG TPA: hypothetical protein VKV17_10215, partial [Bryobacteraceae bacterium]|nr:hypothetical protein [Bryobacteraceae bacterium]
MLSRNDRNPSVSGGQIDFALQSALGGSGTTWQLAGGSTVAATNGQVSLTGDPEPSHKRHWW